jgi:hypothetical protein
MIRALRIGILVSLAGFLLLGAGCSKSKLENPFDYPFIHTFHIQRTPGKPYSDYKAFYLLTEDFESAVESSEDIDRIREALRLARELATKYKIAWTHFVDVNTLAPAFVSDDAQLKDKCREMIADLKRMATDGDDCQLHMHGPLKRELLEFMKSQEKLRVKPSGAKEIQGYRQRRSFFFHTFYAQGYRELVTSLTYGKRLVEQSLYDGRTDVVAFRPGGWDHGSSSQDTWLYFNALAESGLVANSGLVTGEFGTQNWTVGNYPGRNLATVEAGGRSITEISPTTGPGGYVNPVLPNDLTKLANAVTNEMPVIVSVYHLATLEADSDEPGGKVLDNRAALEKHFETVAELVAKKILYPVTLRQMLAILSERD